MNEAFVCEVILKNHERIKRAQFINRDNDYDTVFFCEPFIQSYSGSLKLPINKARKTNLRHSDDLFRKLFLSRSRVTGRGYLNT